MRLRYYKIVNVQSVLLSAMLLLLCACSEDMTKSEMQQQKDDTFAEVDAVDISNASTRAMGMDLNSFAISVYNSKTDKLLANNILYTVTPSGVTSDGSWRMATAEMKAIGISPSMTIVENPTLTATDHYFDYTVPTTEQTMLKISSNMSFTKKSTNNKLSLKFVNALSLFTIKARNELKVEDDNGVKYDVKIYVKSVTLHNLAAKGRFTFTGDYKGSWTAIDNVYANYTQVLPTPIELSTTTFVNVMDSLFVFLPQSPENNSWSPAGVKDAPAEDAISVADANHKVYIEIRCAMTTERENNTIYLWGDENTYEPIYFPYIKKYCPKAWNVINRQAVYNLHFMEGEALTSEGKPIEPQAQSGEGGDFVNAVFISVAPTDDSDNDNVDDWEDPDPFDVTI